MLEHSFRVVKIGNTEQLVMDFKDSKYELLSMFLESEVSNFSDWIKSTIDLVLSGEQEKQAIAGNFCELEINSKTTKLYNALAEDGMGNWCEVDTKELRQLIEEWCDEVRKFKSLQK